MSIDTLLDDPDAFDDPERHRAKDFLKHSNALFNLALVNRKFSLLVPEALYYSLHMGADLFATAADGETRSRIAYLLRTLYERPKLTSHIRELCVYINNDTYPCLDLEEQTRSRESDWCRNLSAVEPVYIESLTECVRRSVSALRIPSPQVIWRWYEILPEDLNAIILGALLIILPQLETLSFVNLASPLFDGPPSLKHDLWAFDSERYEDSLKSAPITITPKLVKLSRLFLSPLFGIEHFCNLQLLDISSKLSGWNQNFLRGSVDVQQASFRTDLDSVQSLRVDCQISTVGIWNQQTQACLHDLLASFNCLQSLDFYAEATNEKNPFRSVRAFPHYQSNIQTYPDDVLGESPDTSNQSWDQRLYDARTEFTDFQHLVDSIHHLRPTLQTLRLPGGFWTLPGGARKSLPRFAQFFRLSKLTVPQAAIISLKLDNMVPLDENKGDFALSPSEALPPQIGHLTVFDAELGFLKSIWLITLMVEQSSHRRWANFQYLTILFGPSCTEEELNALKTRETFVPFWTLVNKTGLRITLGRDDNIPMLDY